MLNAAPGKTREPAALLDAVATRIAKAGPSVVAFSAGVDSTVVLAVAQRVLGDGALAVTGLSPSVAPAEADDAARIAQALGATLIFRPTTEMDDPDYVANGPDRCFHCKTDLYAVCREVVRERGLTSILNGTNADDVGDWRPGLRAADEAGVHSPLLSAGLTKNDVRALARHLDLPNWDKPALACLASRLPYGTAVTPERLAAVDRVEQHLRARGFREVRARYHGSDVRLEVEPERVAELTSLDQDQSLLETVRAAGFDRFTVEPDGYRSGRLNDDLAGAGR
jgi:uncharacterized protein